MISPIARIALLLLLTAVPLSGQQTPVRTRPVEDLVNIDFRNDLRLFTVMCALNAAGFKAETEGYTTGWPRDELQAYFEQLSPSVLEPLQDFLKQHAAASGSETQAALTSLALTLRGPPGFEPALTADQLPAEARDVAGFAALLPAFWEQAKVGRLWEIYEPRYVQELERYRPVVRDVIRTTLDYFRIPARIVLDRQILLIPDLLNMGRIVNARNLDRTYTIIVGPVEDPASNQRQLQHEYLHFLIDPLTEKFGARALENRGLLEMAHRQPSIRDDYRDRFLLIVTESLIEAIQMRLEPGDDVPARRVDLFRRGLILLPHFVRQLESFEATDASLPSALPEMLEAISESEIGNDLARIAELENTLAAADESRRREIERRRAAAEDHNRRADLLNEAGTLMEQDRLDDATARLKELLVLEPDSGEAHFYLGQIASRRKLHDQAFGHYSKAAIAAGVRAEMRAWALVRMGLYLAAQGEFEKARTRFQQVLSLEGDLRGARREAESRLNQLPAPPSEQSPQETPIFKDSQILGESGKPNYPTDNRRTTQS